VTAGRGASDRSRKPVRGRRPGGEDTRARILDAARAAFGERGFEGASIREVAARAAVDPALVHHYFGTKQRLFVAAMRFPVDVNEVVPRLLAGGEPGVGERFVRFVVALWDQPEVRPMLLGVVRSASTDEVAADMMRAILAEGPLLALATAVPRGDAQLRATLAGSQLVGLVLARYIVKVEPLASMTPDEVAASIGPTIERYLFDG
jgi:AcrR family transcriptional regulator